MTRIHNIGHIHNANFVQTQFSTSHPKKWHFLKKRKFTFLWKYSVCGFKFEISEYPKKLPYVTYSPYKYELYQIKTHEFRAKYFPRFFSPHCIISLFWNNLSIITWAIQFSVNNLVKTWSPPQAPLGSGFSKDSVPFQKSKKFKKGGSVVILPD